MTETKQRILSDIANAKKSQKLQSYSSQRWGSPKPEPYNEAWYWDGHHLDARIYYSFPKGRLVCKLLLNGEQITQTQLKKLFDQ